MVRFLSLKTRSTEALCRRCFAPLTGEIMSAALRNGKICLAHTLRYGTPVCFEPVLAVRIPHSYLLAKIKMKNPRTKKRLMVEHDVSPGKLSRCQITGSANLFEIIDLGHQPPCDSLLSKDKLDAPETHYPLRLFHCPDSGLAQLDYVIDGSVIYYPVYPYRSGISKPLEEYQRAFAGGVVKNLGIPRGSLSVDIGSNDGTLLTGFRRVGMKTLGVEPTNIAKIARKENNIDTIQSFFTEVVAKDIVKEYGHAKVATMTNVFAHMAPLGEVMRGLVALLSRDGVFITESQYLLDVLEKNQFDGIYHEHIRTYSLKSLVTLFPYYGMEDFDVERGDRYGGNIRAYIARKGVRPISKK